MKWQKLHTFDLTPLEAIALQKKLREQIMTKPAAGLLEDIRCIAGADMAIDSARNDGFAVVIVYEYPGLVEIERQTAQVPLTFPYTPGLLAFREAPVLLVAFEKIKNEPDLIFFDGQGIAHPRRFGIASHMGLLLDCPTIGCAKSKLIGTFNEPGPDAGKFSYLFDGDERIGAVLRTKVDSRPIFVSPGHKIDIESAVQWTLNVCDGVRIPKPTREADQLAAREKQLIHA